MTGKPLIDAIYTNEVYGNGPYTLREPHLLALPNEGVTFRVELGNRALWEAIGKSFGSHHKDGVFYAWGKPFKRGFKAPNAEVYDLVPTVLAAMKLPQPSAFDGRILGELFQEEIQPARPLPSTSGEPNSGTARDKLKKLLID